MGFDFETDEVTKLLLENTVYFLQRYFGYSENKAIGLVNRYHKEWEPVHKNDDFYHHEGAFYVAVRIHYFMTLKGDEDEFFKWRRENYHDIPNEAIEYCELNFFKILENNRCKENHSS
jgi:hypothetical protein